MLIWGYICISLNIKSYRNILIYWYVPFLPFKQNKYIPCLVYEFVLRYQRNQAQRDQASEGIEKRGKRMCSRNGKSKGNKNLVG